MLYVNWSNSLSSGVFSNMCWSRLYPLSFQVVMRRHAATRLDPDADSSNVWCAPPEPCQGSSTIWDQYLKMQKWKGADQTQSKIFLLLRSELCYYKPLGDPGRQLHTVINDLWSALDDCAMKNVWTCWDWPFTESLSATNKQAQRVRLNSVIFKLGLCCEGLSMMQQLLESFTSWVVVISWAFRSFPVSKALR